MLADNPSACVPALTDIGPPPSFVPAIFQDTDITHWIFPSISISSGRYEGLKGCSRDHPFFKLSDFPGDQIQQTFCNFFLPAMLHYFFPIRFCLRARQSVSHYCVDCVEENDTEIGKLKVILYG